MEGKPSLNSHLIWTDPEINIRIYAQLCHLQFSELLEKPVFERFFRYTECVMHKLHATKYHVHRYAELEEIQLQECSKRLDQGDMTTYESLDLIFELEAFLFQIKSSLDMLVKLMIPVLGKQVKTQTYAAKGDNLIRGLEQYKKNKSSQIDKVQDFIDMLVWAKGDWIENVIDIRDELNHTRGLTSYSFSVDDSNNSKKIPIKPRFKGMDTLEFMFDIYGRNLVFHQDFACLALALVAPPAFKLANLPEGHLVGDFSGYLKWGWAFVLPPAE